MMVARWSRRRLEVSPFHAALGAGATAILNVLVAVVYTALYWLTLVVTLGLLLYFVVYEHIPARHNPEEARESWLRRHLKIPLWFFGLLFLARLLPLVWTLNPLISVVPVAIYAIVVRYF